MRPQRGDAVGAVVEAGQGARLLGGTPGLRRSARERKDDRRVLPGSGPEAPHAGIARDLVQTPDRSPDVAAHERDRRRERHEGRERAGAGGHDRAGPPEALLRLVEPV